MKNNYKNKINYIIKYFRKSLIKKKKYLNVDMLNEHELIRFCTIDNEYYYNFYYLFNNDINLYDDYDFDFESEVSINYIYHNIYVSCLWQIQIISITCLLHVMCIYNMFYSINSIFRCVCILLIMS